MRNAMAACEPDFARCVHHRFHNSAGTACDPKLCQDPQTEENWFAPMICSMGFDEALTTSLERVQLSFSQALKVSMTMFICCGRIVYSPGPAELALLVVRVVAFHGVEPSGVIHNVVGFVAYCCWLYIRVSVVLRSFGWSSTLSVTFLFGRDRWAPLRGVVLGNHPGLVPERFAVTEDPWFDSMHCHQIVCFAGCAFDVVDPRLNFSSDCHRLAVGFLI